MSVRDELHRLVSHLPDDVVEDALAYLRTLSGDSTTILGRFVPLVTSGREFFDRPGLSLEELAERQGVNPIRNIDDVLGDFWPEDESPDEFLLALREWRDEDARA